MSTITVVPTVEPLTTPPRVKLDVTDTGSPNLFAASVTRLNPDGTTSVVRTSDGNPLVLTTSGATRIGTVYDYEAPYGAPVSYSTLESPGTVSAEVTIDETQVWLIHPGVPSLSIPISVASFADQTRSIKRGVYWPMGRKSPVIQTDGARKSVESSLDVRIRILSELDALEAITSDATTLLLNVPASLEWGVPTCYIAVGDITESRLIDYAADPNRYVTLPYLVVDRPVGGTQAARTLADLMVYPTLGDLNTAYASLLALQTGP